MMKLELFALVAAAAVFETSNAKRLKGPPPGLRAVDVSIDENKDWRMTVGPDSPWGSRIEDDDELIGWSHRKKRNFELRWHQNDLLGLSDFLCDHIGDTVYLWVEDHRTSEGVQVKVPVTDDEEWC